MRVSSVLTIQSGNPIKEALAPFGIKSVPIVEEGKVLPETIAELVEYSKGKSVVRKEQKREGVVMRNVQRNSGSETILLSSWSSSLRDSE